MAARRRRRSAPSRPLSGPARFRRVPPGSRQQRLAEQRETAGVGGCADASDGGGSSHRIDRDRGRAERPVKTNQLGNLRNVQRDALPDLRLDGEVERSVRKSSVPLALAPNFLVSMPMLRSTSAMPLCKGSRITAHCISVVESTLRNGLTASASLFSGEFRSILVCPSDAGPTSAITGTLIVLSHCLGEFPLAAISMRSSVLPPRTSRLAPIAASSAPRSMPVICA